MAAGMAGPNENPSAASAAIAAADLGVRPAVLERAMHEYPGFASVSPLMNREAGPAMKRENPTPEFEFCGLSSHETRTTFAISRAAPTMSDKRRLSDIE
ncbi:hypothetical protein IY145_02090 [Methylosinus sp. H3A]|uniref:hypothetical protein n=1 Tax=Methylosinus sp. H3A TaxID=2785786 RepID=UPI0018C31BE6|nr:hypothetical protein [Methylosinus sp. H3A]MBG0808195.1 hypothetical protein [Methylosinus sp. H3A]